MRIDANCEHSALNIEHWIVICEYNGNALNTQHWNILNICTIPIHHWTDLTEVYHSRTILTIHNSLFSLFVFFFFLLSSFILDCHHCQLPEPKLLMFASYNNWIKIPNGSTLRIDCNAYENENENNMYISNFNVIWFAQLPYTHIYSSTSHTSEKTV